MTFTIDHWNHGSNVVTQKCIENIMKENPLLLKDLLKPKLTKFKYAKLL